MRTASATAAARRSGSVAVKSGVGNSERGRIGFGILGS